MVLDHTPFYAESGGQIGDTGDADRRRRRASRVQRHAEDRRLVRAHRACSSRASCASATSSRRRSTRERRTAIALNHSATHLLHAALREVLGKHVQQKGSLVAPDRLRFDFSHTQAVSRRGTAPHRRAGQRRDSRATRRRRPASWRCDDAVAAGAMSLFGEKYESDVRVLSIGDFSMELCGGTHVERAGDIGFFKIISESGVAAGVRRIEAVTGQAAYEWVVRTDQVLRDVAGMLRGSREDVDEKVRELVERSRRLEKEVQQLKSKLASGQGGDLSAQAKAVGGIKVLAAQIEGADAKALRDAVDQLKHKLGSSRDRAGDGSGRQSGAGCGCFAGFGRAAEGRRHRRRGRGSGGRTRRRARGFRASGRHAAGESRRGAGGRRVPGAQAGCLIERFVYSDGKMRAFASADSCILERSIEFPWRFARARSDQQVLDDDAVPRAVSCTAEIAKEVRSTNMLILTRRVGETVMIGNEVTVTVLA